VYVSANLSSVEPFCFAMAHIFQSMYQSRSFCSAQGADVLIGLCGIVGYSFIGSYFDDLLVDINKKRFLLRW
jgi:hypothetical protein